MPVKKRKRSIKGHAKKSIKRSKTTGPKKSKKRSLRPKNMPKTKPSEAKVSKASDNKAALVPVSSLPMKTTREFTLKKNYYYLIYSIGFFLLALAVFIFVKNIMATISLEPGSTNAPSEIQFSTPTSSGSSLTAEEMLDLLNNSGKLDLLPPDYKIQIYFYDDKGVARPDLYFTFRDGKVTKGKLKDYDLSISTNRDHIPELRESTNFCLMMETIWVTDKDIKIEYGTSKSDVFSRYGAFASACIPSAIQSVTGFASLIDAMASADVWNWKNFKEKVSKPDAFFWYVVLFIALLIGVRSYLDMIKDGY